MDAQKDTATDGGTTADIDRDELYQTVHVAVEDALMDVLGTVLYLIVAFVFIVGGGQSIIASPGPVNTLFGSGMIGVGLVIAAVATGVFNLR